ncbi:Abortive infection bacteriophage resistance protein [Isobaculum melis]|uniref:Abortive infection bacteriophage resistance protein n=2 Tax=Isobaculum melis TaxID=142588 RepID=A0A1H9SU48_9LACT|nr:Abortive infection bacteriophage resistance protein [Isobaculum melis]
MNDNFALKALQQIGYFRFKGYCLPYYYEKDLFKQEITFEQIHKNYRFDERLRLLTFQIIEHVEVELKSVISGEFAMQNGPLGHYESSNFNNTDYHVNWMNRFEQLVSQSSKRRELYTEHYITNYQSTFPVWVATEISDFGSISRFYKNLDSKLKNKISKGYYNISGDYLANWIYVLSITRNVCAHNGRVYDRELAIDAKWHKEDFNINRRRIFATIYICKKICLDTLYYEMFKKNLNILVEMYQDCIDLKAVGFPSNWRKILEIDN